MITIGAFFGNEFNQNGDLANLEVIQRACVNAGSYVVAKPNLQDGQQLFDADYLVVGDGSKAHQRHRSSEITGLVEIVREREHEGKPTLLVGSSYEHLWGKLTGSEFEARKSRLSGFYSTLVEGHEFWGYVNTQSSMPLLAQHGSTTGTAFFGPFLARNVYALEKLLASLGCKADDSFLTELRRLMEISPNYREAQSNRI